MLQRTWQLRMFAEKLTQPATVPAEPMKKPAIDTKNVENKIEEKDETFENVEPLNPYLNPIFYS